MEVIYENLSLRVLFFYKILFY